MFVMAQKNESTIKVSFIILVSYKNITKLLYVI